MIKPKTKSRRKPQPSTAVAILAVVEAVVAAYKLATPFFKHRKKAKAQRATTKKKEAK